MKDNRIEVNSSDTEGYSPLHTACKNGQLGIVEILLSDDRCRINIQTAFYIACNVGQTKIVEFMLKNCSDLCIPYGDFCSDVRKILRKYHY